MTAAIWRSIQPAACAGPTGVGILKSAEAMHRSDGDSIIKNELSNRLTYYICDTSGAEEVEMHLLIKIGSRSEKDGETGAAHFLEHMCLGFNRAGLRENRVHGYTSFEETGFCVYSPSDAKSICDAMDILMGVLSGEIIDPEQLEDIRGDVIEEWHTQMEGDYFRKRNRIYSRLLPQGLYERMPIGRLEDISKMEMGTLYRFHNNYYVTGLASLICVGSFSNIDMEAAVREKFGSLPYRTYDVSYIPEAGTDKEGRCAIGMEWHTPETTTYGLYALHKRETMSQTEFCRNCVIEEFAFSLTAKLLKRDFLNRGIQCTACDFYKNRITAGYEMLTLQISLGGNRVRAREVKKIICGGLRKLDVPAASNDLFEGVKREISETILRLKDGKTDLARECINNYLFGEPILTRREEYTITKGLVRKITQENICGSVLRWRRAAEN